jgi:hypothetical protein
MNTNSAPVAVPAVHPIPVTDVKVGMKDSSGNEILAVRQTKARVYITLKSWIDGKPYEQPKGIKTQMFVQVEQDEERCESCGQTTPGMCC